MNLSTGFRGSAALLPALALVMRSPQLCDSGQVSGRVSFSGKPDTWPSRGCVRFPRGQGSGPAFAGVKATGG